MKCEAVKGFALKSSIHIKPLMIKRSRKNGQNVMLNMNVHMHLR